MSKIGVGVGDDFPVDDSNNRNTSGPEAPRDDRAEFEEWKRRRDAHRAQREAWRAQKDEWRRRRDEWKAQARAARDEYRAAHPGAADYSYYGRRRGFAPFYLPHFFGFGLMRILMFVAVIALIIFAISHIGYILAGLVAIAVLFAAYHHFGHDPFDLPHSRGRDYSRTMTTPPPANSPPATTINNGNSAPPAPRDPAA